MSVNVSRLHEEMQAALEASPSPVRVVSVSGSSNTRVSFTDQTVGHIPAQPEDTVTQAVKDILLPVIQAHDPSPNETEKLAKVPYDLRLEAAEVLATLGAIPVTGLTDTTLAERNWARARLIEARDKIRQSLQ